MESRLDGFFKTTKLELRTVELSAALQLPLVSIIVTNHNYQKYIVNAVESVAKQTYNNFERIIIDDCSIDRSPELATNFINDLEDPRFRLIRLGLNLGQMGAMRAGLENASGVFISFLDADDVLLPNFIQKHVEAHLNSAFSGGVTACDTLQIDQEGNITETTSHMLAKRRTPDPNAALKYITSSYIPIIVENSISFESEKPRELFYLERYVGGWLTSACSSLMFRRSILDLVCPKDVSVFRICADYYFATFAHLISGTIVIPEALAAWRLHGRNNFSNNTNIGGRHAPGNFQAAGRYDAEIAKFVIMNFERLSPVIGASTCHDIVCRFVPRHKLYKASRRSPSFQKFVGGGSKRKFWIRYGVYYRYVRKKNVSLCHD